jgi:hypothetical protein
MQNKLFTFPITITSLHAVRAKQAVLEEGIPIIKVNFKLNICCISENSIPYVPTKSVFSLTLYLASNGFRSVN